MNDFFNTLCGTFFGAFLAFIFNNMQEKHREENKEKNNLLESVDIIKKQINYFRHTEDVLNENYRKDVVLFSTKDGFDIKPIIDKDCLDWLKYGKLMQCFIMLEIVLEKVVFLVNKKNCGNSILDAIRKSAGCYQQIKNLIQIRDEHFDKLDVFFSTHEENSIFDNRQNKNKLNDLLVFGKSVTLKLLKELKDCQKEFDEAAKNIDIYIKDAYPKKYFLNSFFYFYS